MNILLRIVAVLVLLGSLAYGSYAVGRYVLSEKLFGSSVNVQPSSGLVASSKPRITSRGVSTTGVKPPIEVQVLPADQADSGPDVSSIKDLQTASPVRRSSSATVETPKIVNANTLAQSRARLKTRRSSGSTIFGQSGVQGSDEDERVSRRSRRNRDRDEERPRRRRRKRRNRSGTTNVVADTSRPRSLASNSDSSPSRRSSDTPSDSRPARRSSSGSSSDAPARSQGGSSASDDSNGPF